MKYVLLKCDFAIVKLIAFEVYIALDHTPFYAESGGQVADRGRLIALDSSIPCQVAITDVQKKSGIWLHLGKVKTGQLSTNQVSAYVDDVSIDIDFRFVVGSVGNRCGPSQSAKNSSYSYSSVACSSETLY